MHGLKLTNTKKRGTLEFRHYFKLFIDNFGIRPNTFNFVLLKAQNEIHTKKEFTELRTIRPQQLIILSEVRPQGKRMLSSVKTSMFLQLFAILIGHNKLDMLEAIINLY